MKKLFVFLLLALFVFALSFTASPNAPKPAAYDSDSELAVLMREMFDDGMRVKGQIQRGESPEIAVDYEKVHTAEAFQPEKTAPAEYEAFARAYVQAVKTLLEAQAGETATRYTAMVDACMDCHRSFCPGPMMRIKQMYFN
jgi:cytochrome c556